MDYQFDRERIYCGRAQLPVFRPVGVIVSVLRLFQVRQQQVGKPVVEVEVLVIFALHGFGKFFAKVKSESNDCIS